MMRRDLTQSGNNAISGAARGEIVSVDDSKMMQLATVKLMTGETLTDIELGHPYGFASHPLPGAEVLVVFQGSARSHPVAMLAPDRRHRKTGLAPGEMALADDRGQFTHLMRDGKSELVKGGWRVAVEGDDAFIELDADKILYLGGNPTDHTMARVSTEAGPALNVYARVG